MGFVGEIEDGIGTGALPPLPKGRGTKPCLVVGYRKRSNAVFSSVLSLCIYPPTANAVPPPLGKEGNASAQFHLPDKPQFIAQITDFVSQNKENA